VFPGGRSTPAPPGNVDVRQGTNTNTIPTEDDWHSEQRTLDSSHAYAYFRGKDLREAFKLFVHDALCYQEDIMFMPVRCFRFYVHAYMDYLLSEKSKGDSDGANCFFGIVTVRHADIIASGEELRDRVRHVLGYLATRQQWYDADRAAYGDFAKQAEDALRLLAPDAPSNS
jgi:hypothetical protein